MLKLDADPTKTEVQTRDGRPAVILHYDPEQKDEQLIGYTVTNGQKCATSWYANGNMHSDGCTSGSDLVNVPPKPVVEKNEYYAHVIREPDDTISYGCWTKKLPSTNTPMRDDPIAVAKRTVTTEWTEGDFREGGEAWIAHN